MQLRTEGRDRGQVIIVAALVFAAIFVGLALVLNSGIYAENLSSRETTDTEGALSFTLETDEAIAEAYERTNRNDSATADEARKTFNATVDSWESAQQRRGATQGIGVDVERTPHVGWRLEQGTAGSYSSSSSTEDWTLATGASDVGAFRLNTTRGDLYDATSWSGVNSSFNVRIDDGSDVWRLYVFRNDSHVVVHEGVPGEHSGISSLPDGETCASEADPVVLDFRAETLGGSSCSPLNFSDDLDGAVDLSFENGTQVRGTYTIVVNGSSAADKTNFNGPNDAAPTAQAVVYSASYASHYGRADLTFERRGTYAVREETYAS